jgi:subtilase family serine protease
MLREEDRSAFKLRDLFEIFSHDVTRMVVGVKHIRLLAPAFLAALVVLVAAGAGAADSGPQIFRDHGHGDWFRNVCELSIGPLAGCDARVVTDASGDPLAGSSPPSTALGPAQLNGAYQLPGVPPDGSTPTVAIVDAYDDPNIASDLATFDTQYGLPCNSCFTKVNQSGGTSYPAENSGWDLEISLDVETVHSICQSCHILLVEASSSSIANLGAAENEAAALGATAITNSWGASESSGETSWDNAYFDHPGIAITASTGDSGYGVEWPAASQYVTAVGGTTLTVSGNTYVGETAWVDGGSGCSSVESQPSFQAGLGTCANRSVADVAADADPNTGVAVYDSVPYSGSAGWFQVGGTSLSSPIIASIYALADHTSSITNGATPYAYLGTSNLHDVTSGSNGSCGGSYLCTAGNGYDGPTGVGTPDGIGAFIPKAAAPPTPDFSLSASAQSGTPVAGTGGAATYSIKVSDIGTFSDQVSLTAAGLPSGATASFSPNPSSGNASTLTVNVASSVASGSYGFTITGTDTGSSLNHTINATLTVTAPAPDFSIAVSPGTQSVGPTGSTTYTITVTPLNNFSGTVSLSVSGLPRNVSASFSPSSARAGSGWRSTMTVSSRRASASTSTLTVSGRYSSLSHSSTTSLTVT